MANKNKKVRRNSKVGSKKEILPFITEPKINNRLRQCRKSKGYTQKQVAFMMNVKRQEISRWEREITYPGTINLLKLSYVYNRLMDYLYYDLGKKFSPEIKRRKAELFPDND